MASALPLDDGSGISLSDRVAETLQGRVISGEIPVGSWIRHGAVAEEFAISRTPVREALRILAERDVVTIVPNRGARVNGQSPSDIRLIGAVRSELEGLAAQWAAGRIDDRLSTRLETAWDRFREIADGSAPGDLAREWAAANEEFHAVILEAAGNKYLSLSVAELRRRLPHNISFGAYAGNSRLLARNLAEHDDISRAVLGGEADRARELMTAHIRSSVEAVADWLDRSGGPGR
ncbi:GntR family transcriptional regulator [Pseudonocardia sp. HH130630-07]|uniref:GntR family transcriptional regulator n=1 Tax=Pseudonocardia sp. HH130630-07 TaxID=1690815 RepID=UPI000815356F|nr:GntR family transcriptional regulator [Pseudonocardia sp. HH130630-07]ANY09396.1 GntR family transcriptional regulator [Pseudonocardia sp. HH130630-07]